MEREHIRFRRHDFFLVILAPNVNVFVQQQISVSGSIHNRIEFMTVVSYEMYIISKIK